MTWAVETIGVTRIYRTEVAQPVYALRGVDLRIAAGQVVALKGRSGSGKTTLLNCIGGLDHPSAGTVRIFGHELTALSERELTLWRREQIGFVFQSFGLLPTHSAYENVELMMRLAKASRKQRRLRTLECLELVGLGRWQHHRPYELSGGQQQRVAIARAIANQPQIILADEPTGELDSETAREIFALFRHLVEVWGVTVLMATHDNLADEYADTVLQLQDGQIRAAPLTAD